MSSLQHVQQLERWVDDSVARIRNTALESPRGGDGACIGLLEQLGVTPLDPQARARHLAEGAPTTRGALPMELRWALEAIERQASPLCRQLDMGLATDDDDAQRRVDKLAHRLGNLVNAELGAYMRDVRPQITTSSIFANALSTSRNYTAESTQAGAKALSCGCCGAPRKDGDESMVCQYCGSDL